MSKENEEKLEDEDALLKNVDTPTFDNVREEDVGEVHLEDEKERIEELSAEQEARARQFYDPEENTYDYRKKRVTDIRENSRVTLPRPVLEIQEAGIAMRRERVNSIAAEYIRENCNEKNEQEPNLTVGEAKGLKSLQRRIKEREIVVMSTDKSCKLAVTTMDKYLEMGAVHTRLDKEISREEFIEIEKIVNGHTAMHIKMQGMGENWQQGKRMRGITMTRSQNLASLSLLLKDHKKELKTRQVVSGNESNTVGLSNIMSDLTESLANAVENPH